MAGTNIIINGPSGTEEAKLNPKGSLLGRGANCDIILDGNGVSRHHARIYQDPFGRWIIEDLNSRNGIYVQGQPVKAHAMSPDELPADEVDSINRRHRSFLIALSLVFFVLLALGVSHDFLSGTNRWGEQSAGILLQ